MRVHVRLRVRLRVRVRERESVHVRACVRVRVSSYNYAQRLMHKRGREPEEKKKNSRAFNNYERTSKRGSLVRNKYCCNLLYYIDYLSLNVNMIRINH